MGAAVDKVFDALTTNFGIGGLIIVILMAVIYRLFTLYQGVMEKRIEEGRSGVQALEKSAGALESLEKALEANTQVVRDFSRDSYTQHRRRGDA